MDFTRITATANQAVSVIETLPDGASTTTAKIITEICGTIPDDELFMIHAAVYTEIESRGNVLMDYSSHNGKLEGLPFDLEFVAKRLR